MRLQGCKSARLGSIAGRKELESKNTRVDWGEPVIVGGSTDSGIKMLVNIDREFFEGGLHA